PASTTHRQLSEQELIAAGISGGTIRLSVGIETLEDLLWDLERGLTASQVSDNTAHVNGHAAASEASPAGGDTRQLTPEGEVLA
ncbi:MAG TPA: PLP-dependent transferase, partial [Ktedonobacterales bacterium]|nr:PLP-dependent transferase [Ktedonobacterales bacterium]